MSLINKMLQDLDARGGAGEQLHQPEVKAVPGVERDSRTAMLAAGGALVVLVLAAGGWFGWKYWQGRAAARAAANAPVVSAPAAPPAAPAQLPAAGATQAAAPSPAQPNAAAPAAPAAGGVAAAANANGASPAQPPLAAAAASGGEAAHEGAVRGKGGKHDKRTAEDKHAAQAAHDARAERAATKANAKSTASPDGEIIHELSPAQLSENTYRRALVALQEGRVSEALADLERSLDINPRNDAARQTIISLLLENKRTDDAIRQLRLALGIDPRQPGLAMVLARLQLERNGPALETLQRSLPYAENSADYQALMAGVLQRQQRHAEAIEHYDIALKLAPQNAVWWMGLAISLQAEHHNPEARTAFTRARALPGLSTELQAFIDRKLELLAH